MDNEELFSLVMQYLDGDDYAFTTLYNMTKKNVFANIYSYIRNEQASEDILMDVYVKFINTAHKIKKDQSILGYLYVISRNLSINYLKRNQKEELVEDFVLEHDNEEIKSKLDYEDVIVVMKKVLTKDMFNIVILRLVNEMEYSEIASIVKKKEATVRWLYDEGIKKLKEELYVR
jgi:RNA polymerase sigma-70 factor (ECF subfamily)